MASKPNSPTASPQPRVFLSYARKDGEAFARDLRQKLTDLGFSLWQDRTQMEGGKDWWDQIIQALKAVEYMVLVMTEASLASPIVRKEWRQARQEGVGVIPVFGQPNLDLAQLSRWMRDVHWVNTDVPEQWTRFIRTLESPHQGTRVPFMADDLPAGYVPRLKEFEELAGSLLDPKQEEPVAITAALKGAGGYGKTTLAKALCHDERIQDAFHDGILWVTLGEEPDIMAGLTKLYAALTEERPNFVDQDDASNRLAEVLEGKDCVMVIDDVWNAAHVTPFLRGGKRCARIITTRDSGTLPSSAKLRVDVDAMRLREAVSLLAFELPQEEVSALEALAKDLGEWPFLLKLVNATLRDRVNAMRQDLSDALVYVNKALKKRGLTAFDARNPVERNQAVSVTLEASFEHLKKDELARYQELAIFPEDVEIPLAAIINLWSATGGLDDFDAEELCTRLHQLSLVLRYDLTTQRIQLHDVVRTYLEEQVASNLPTLHGQFLDVYDLRDEPTKAAKDPYLCRYVAYHLVKAERWEELKKLLLNPDWLYAKVEALDVPAILSDFDWMQGDNALALVQGAIRLSTDVLGRDSGQLVGQLLGRLQALKNPEIQNLLDKANGWSKNPWLRPLQGSLIASGGPLVGTLSGHSGWVSAIAVLPDGQQAISASLDGTCILWNLVTGEVLQTLRGHSDSVNAMALTRDGWQAISVSDDQTCILWDLATGEALQIMRGHRSAVEAIGVTPDGTRAISGSSAGTCIVWDLATGEALQILRGHRNWVGAIAVTPDGTRMISASDDQTCKVWDLATGQELQTLCGHSHEVNAIVVTPDGTGVISGSSDGTCIVWDLATGEALQTLCGHGGWVFVVAVTLDGTRLVSGSSDSTCIVWDLATGKALQTLRGHRGGVYAVVVTADGTRLVSGSSDCTCIVWDLATGEALQTLCGHSKGVGTIAVTPDGTRLVSGSRDSKCIVWDLATGKVPQILRGHSDEVKTIAVTPDGTRAISRQHHGPCIVWDLATGEALHTLGGPDDWVNAVAVSADGAFAILANDYGMGIVWDLVTGEAFQALRGHGSGLNAVAITPDGTRAISGSSDGTCIEWDLATGEALQTLCGHRDWVTAVAITPDGTRVISASRDGTWIVWDLATGKALQTLGGHGGGVYVVVVRPDGTRVISGSRDGTCIVWDLATGEALQTLGGPDDEVRAVAVTPDGTRVISGSSDSTCIVWDLATGEALQTLCGHGDWVDAVAVTLDGQRAISASRDGTCKVWDLASGQEVATFTGESPISCCAVSPDGRTIVIGESSGRVHVLRLEGVD